MGSRRRCILRRVDGVMLVLIVEAHIMHLPEEMDVGKHRRTPGSARSQGHQHLRDCAAYSSGGRLVMQQVLGDEFSDQLRFVVVCGRLAGELACS